MSFFYSEGSQEIRACPIGCLPEQNQREILWEHRQQGDRAIHNMSWHRLFLLGRNATHQAAWVAVFEYCSFFNFLLSSQLDSFLSLYFVFSYLLHTFLSSFHFSWLRWLLKWNLLKWSPSLNFMCMWQIKLAIFSCGNLLSRFQMVCWLTLCTPLPPQWTSWFSAQNGSQNPTFPWWEHYIFCKYWKPWLLFSLIHLIYLDKFSKHSMYAGTLSYYIIVLILLLLWWAPLGKLPFLSCSHFANILKSMAIFFL